ncbi:MAG: molybdopterin-dependent oxidoreductase [Planctomycetaceae bacterium]|nr:molybdopterin-dependent oxidoreductase [Planctomycetaceae bacterium]
MSSLLTLTGTIKQPVQLSVMELDRLPEEGQIRDISQIVPGREGTAIRLATILDQFPPQPDATHLTLHASRDGFAASLPLDQVRDVGLILYKQGGDPLSAEQGGPFRFLIENAAPCKTAELDACANVKYLDEIEYSVGKGKETR